MLSNATKNQQYLSAMGVQVWLERSSDQPIVVGVADEPLAIESMDVVQLSNRVSDCQRCDLSALGSQKTFSLGAPATQQWLIIGDAPSAEGSPFSASATGLLRDVLLAVDKKIATSYLTTSVKCVQSQRIPSTEEHLCCRPYLVRQIELVKPELVLVLGELAAQSLLSTSDKLDGLRGKPHTLKGVDAPIIVSYQPDEVLRSPLLKKLVWQDLQLARRLILA
ncbi:MAG: uracil-DNA glycosylase [Cycloclasticus sp.]